MEKIVDLHCSGNGRSLKIREDLVSAKSRH